MKHKAVVALTGSLLFALASLVFAYLKNNALHAEIAALKQIKAEPEKPKWDIAVRPLEHDGHRFIIVVTTPGGVALVHHPNCGCARSF